VARLVVRLADLPPGASNAEVRHAVADRDFSWARARSHCRTAWLRGRFLAAGSLSLGARGAHLELVVPSDEADALADRLAEAGFPVRRRERRGRAVLTWKRTETILAFLRSCGARASVLEVESRLVMRQLHGHLNRVLNAESANLERTVASSARQLLIIEQLEAEGRLGSLAPVDLAVAGERRAAPEASFSELALRLGLSRARVQRAFDRLETAAHDGPEAGASAAIPRDL
jgi:DNA-binding protein WhiA